MAVGAERAGGVDWHARIVLLAAEGLPRTEVAELTGTSVPSVRQRLPRLRLRHDRDVKGCAEARVVRATWMRWRP